ncbi:MAG: VTT domain-containing protein [Solirubrobacterales bacterium]|nr:VTT domain-containing protein [Solirubrobacterales bacterium]
MLAPSTPGASGVSRRGLLITLAIMVACGLTIWLVAPLHEAAGYTLTGNTEALREQLLDLGAGGVLVLYGVLLAHVVIWYPAEIPTAAAGFVYGFWLALPILMLGWLISALATYAVGHFAGRPLLYRFAGERRFLRAERVIARGGWPILLAARFVPVMPFSLTGFVAGAAGVPLWRFSWTTVIGFLPITAIFALLGSRLQELSLTDPVLYIALAPILLLLAAGHPLAKRMRAHDDEQPDVEEPVPAGDGPISTP